MKRLALLFVILPIAFLAAPGAASGQDYVYHMVRVDITESHDVLVLQGLGLNIERILPDGRPEIVLFDRELELLEQTGFSYEVVVTDLEAHYAKLLMEDPALQERGFPDGSMGGYYTYSEIVDMLDAWVALYPNLITPKQSIGKSQEGRDIWAVKISDNPNVDENEPEVCFDSLIHAREPASMMTLLWFMLNLLEQYGTDPELTYLVDNREIWFIPCHNPDGYVYNEQNYPNGGGMWRKNRRNNGGGIYGVDLNRNYGYKWGYDNYGSSPNPSSDVYRGPSAFSEPESQAVRDFTLAHPIVTSWNTHTYSDLYLCPFGYANVKPPAADYNMYMDHMGDIAAENGYAYGHIYETIGYPANGGATDWHYATAGVHNITPEIGGYEDGGFWPPKTKIMELVEENYLAIRYWTWIGGSYVLLEDHQLTDDNGDGIFLPGEPVDVTLTLRNKGLGATVSNVTATISSSSPYVTILQGTVDFGIIPGYTTANNNQNPLKVKVNSDTPYGEKIALDVQLDFDGYGHTLQLALICGVPNVLLSLDMESDPGWTVGDTGDDATSGIWVRANPIGTSSSGQQIQPEDDHTPAPGTNCFVTGNGSTSPGGDDVDNGKTTLKTAVFDLSGVAGAQISYWRWYADLGSSPNNDIFKVNISNDGGGTWKDVENLGYTVNSWKQVTFNVEDKITPTGNMMMRFIASDKPNDSLCEACVDDFEIKTYASPIQLALSGPPKIGTTVNIIIDAPTDGGLGYLLVSSLGTYPAIPIGSRWLPLQYDFFLLFSLNPANGVFYNFFGTLDGAGHSAAPQFVIPAMPNLVGKTIFFAGLTLDAAAPEGIKNISAPLPVIPE